VEFRRISKAHAYRLFYPAIAPIVVAEHEKVTGGMPVSSCIPSSFVPATVTIAIGLDHLTHELVLRSGMLTVNFLGISFSEKILKLAQKRGQRVRSSNKLEDVGLRVGRTVSGLPYLLEASAYVELKVQKVVNNYDHDLFISEVIKAYASADFQNYWQFKSYKPAIYVGSGSKGFPKHFGKLMPYN
jgi:flavin reductase (DIM6/NTAB) family NADH-FMN oxidoreductase RutF